MSIESVGSSSGRPPINPQILAQLLALGLQPQGSMQADLAAIKAAQATQTSIQTNNNQSIFASTLNAQSSQPKQGGAAWSNIMDELGIKGSGTSAGDASNILAILEKKSPEEAAAIIANCQAAGLSLNAPQSNGESQSKPEIGKNLLAKLAELGLQSSGNKATDVANIQKAHQGDKPKGGGAPWSSIMDELGIKGSGSAEGDATNISALIATMQPDEAASITSRCQALGLTISTPT
ncbi:MAG: hypothetical protein WCG23_00230 [bacterium]